MARRKTAKKGNTVTVDFEGVEGRTVIPEGEYVVKVLEVEEGESNNGNPKLTWKFEITDGEYEGKNLYYTSSLVPEALWRLRSLLEALGLDVPDSEMDIDLDELVDAEVNVSVEHDTYEGKKQSKIVDFWGEGSQEEDEEEEKPAKKGKGKKKEEEEKPAKGKKGKKKKEEEELEKLTAEEVQGMDEDELGEVIEKYELDVDLDDFKTLKKKANAVIDALEAAEMIEED